MISPADQHQSERETIREFLQVLIPLQSQGVSIRKVMTKYWVLRRRGKI